MYNAGSSKVRDLRGWVITPSGKGIKLGKETAYDRMHQTDSFNSNELYVDVRERGISCPFQIDAGGVFGSESVTEDRPVFEQFEWYFQDRLPALISRFSLTL